MSLYALDTDTISLFRRGHALVRQQVATHAGDEITTTAITVEEQLTGWYTYMRRKTQPSDVARGYRELIETVTFFAGWSVLLFTEPAIDRYKNLLGQKLSVGKADLKIAAIALENNATLVTRNLRDFQRVPGLVLENWAA